MASPLYRPTITCFRVVLADPEETAAFLRARLPDYRLFSDDKMKMRE